MSWLRPIIALSLAALFSALSLAQGAPSPQELCDAAEPAALTPMQFAEAERVLQPDTDYRAILCTSAGAIYVDLYENLTTFTVNSFVFLAGQGYYDSTTFHRVIPDFMAQGGDPTGTGRGGPGYQFKDEPVGFLTFDRPGLLAMANSGPRTNGSQFFITTVPTPHLNHKHTVFGDVLVGQDVVEAIRERDPSTASEPGETLYTVLIVTDPAEVDNSDVVELEPATQEQVVAAIEAFAQALPEFVDDSELTGLQTTEALAATLPEDLQQSFAAYADLHGHQYRYRLNLINHGCDEAIFFSSLGYQVDVFEDENAALQAAFDEFIANQYEGLGYRLHGPYSTYTKDEPTCDGHDGAHLVTHFPYGRILVTLDLLFAREILASAPTTRSVLEALSLQIEPAFTDIFWPEIR